MKLRSWLSFSFERLVVTSHRGRGRGLAKKRIDRPVIIEMLEQRQLLSAGPVAFGTETQVNTFTQGDQTSPSVAMDSAGDYMTVWTSVGQDGSAGGIYAQRYNAQGLPIGSEFRVNTTTINDQASPRVAMDAAGDAVVVWNSFLQDGSGEGIYGQRFDAAGVPQGSEFLVNTYTSGNQWTPQIAMDSAGDFVVAWTGQGAVADQTGSDQGIYAQQFNSQGVAQGGEIHVAGSLAITPTVAMNSAGNFAIGWSAPNSAGEFAQRYNANGTPLGSKMTLSNVAGIPAIAMDSNGDLIAVSRIAIPTSGYSLVAQRFDTTGAATGSPISIQSTTTTVQASPSVATDVNGNFVVAWQNGANISAEQFTSLGDAQGNAFQVNTNTASSKTSPAIAFDGSNFVTAWQSANQDGSGAGIYQQFYTAAPNLNLSGLGQTTTYDQKSAPVAIAPGLILNAPAGDQITSATVSFTNWQPEDRLTFSNTAALQHTFTTNATTDTAILTLTGTASAAAYQQVLQSVSYQDVAGDPNTSVTRIATFTVNDATTSATGTQSVNAVAVLGGLNQTQTYLQGQPPISITPDLVITIPATQNVTSATVQFTNWLPEDQFAISNSAVIANTFTVNSSTDTATLTLTGTAPASAYQTELQSMTYQDIATNPNVAAIRNAVITLNAGQYTADGFQSLRVATVLEGFGQNLTFTSGSAPIAFAPNADVTLPQGVQATSATLTFSNWQVAEDRLAFGNISGLQTSFTTNPGANTATLTVTGNASAAAYQSLLQSLTYQDTATNPNTTATRIGTLTLNYGSTSATATQNLNVTG